MCPRDRADVQPIPFPTRRPTARGDNRAMHLQLVTDPTAARTPSGLGADRTVIANRATKPAVLKEHPTMYANLGLNHAYAESRRQDLLAEAERARRLEQVAAAARRPAVAAAVAGLRCRVGVALVRAGHRIHGAGSAKPAANVVPTIATLRCAR